MTLRVLVAEDSPTARALLVAMLESDGDIRVVGQAESGEAAVREAERLRPDVITMDVHMPGLDGLGATRRIMSRFPTPIVIVSALAADDVRMSLEATRAGALVALPKPTNPNAPDFEWQRTQLLAMVKAMASVKVVRRWSDPSRLSPTPTPTRASVRGAARVRLVAIGASTGGPAALRDVLSSLPADFPVPILIVQHIARGFVAGLAKWLDNETALDVRVAESGETLEAGVVYIAPDDRHLGVTRRGDALHIVLSDEPAVGSFRPSATHLFASAAAVGTELVAVILTGMGDDGVAGLRRVFESGGRVLAQDETSSIIYGMPREAVRAGVVHDIVALGDIAARLTALVGA